MNRANRRSPWIALCARLTLAAFAATLPGPAAWAQAVDRVAPLTASFSAPATIAPSALSSIRSLSAPAAASALSAAPLAAPMAALEAAPSAAAPISADDAVQHAGAPAVSAIETLNLAAGDATNGSTGGNAVVRYDGGSRRGGSDDDGSNGGPNDRKPLPAKAPVLAMTNIFFPGTGAISVALGAAHIPFIAAAMRNGGYAISATRGKETAQGHNAMATLVRIHLPIGNSDKTVAEITPIRMVKITGYDKTPEGVALAKVSYLELKTSDPAHLDDLRLLAHDTLEEFAPLDPELPADAVGRILKETNAERMTALIVQSFPFPRNLKFKLLAAPSTEARLREAIMEMNAHFKSKAAEARAAAEGTLADPLESVDALKRKLETIGMPEAIQAITLKEYDKYATMGPMNAESSKTRTYIEWLIEMPWGRRTEDSSDIAAARTALDRDHSGLENVKERVLEFLALRKKTGTKKGAILVFTGPPGVGKTTIAAAIAAALGRKFVRLSLGGVHDESVLRGHGRTYTGSMPGEIMRQMKTAGTVNPVMLLDEADKLGRNGAQGDPTAALLEVLDPKQNDTFRDRYLDVPYDLSEVLFIVTSNDLSNIPEPLRDRMEIIEFDGYTPLEKMKIAEKHLIPQKLAAAGLTPGEATLTPAALRRVIEEYTQEAGVRGLEEKLMAVMRKVSAWMETKGAKAPGAIDAQDIEKYLGVPIFSPSPTAQNAVGVATGLAVRGNGGSTLNVEVSYERGNGQLRLRKAFGDDIYDSAFNAYKYVKTHAAQYGLEKVDFTKLDLDINITPAGKVDGPSAGGLMVTAIISALTGRSVTPVLAMTGEITMRGDILPIGGLAKKVMAAHRMGYKEVIFPAENLKDVASIPQEVRDEMILKPAKTYDDIYPDSIAAETTKTPAAVMQAAPRGFLARLAEILRALSPWS